MTRHVATASRAHIRAWDDARVDVDTLAWLRSEDGVRALAATRTALAAGEDDLAVGSRLRRSLLPERAAAVVSQVRLRQRAAAKFGGLAASMWFLPDALEQATRLPVAEHRAARLSAAAGAAGTADGSRPGWSVVDLGCGIGGDLIAMARAGLVVAGVERDPVRAAIAAANLADLGLGGAVTVAEATAVDVRPFDAALCDPARRDGSGRTWDPEVWSPPWSFVSSLLRGSAVVKTAPGIAHEAVPAGVEAEFVSDHGDLKEAALWGGALATCERRATVLRSGHAPATLTDADDPGPDAVGLRPVEDYLLEPDDAVVRAGLVTAVAAAAGGGLVDPHLAYVSAPRPLATPLARSYRVVEEVPYREKALRAALQARGIGSLTIKKRGVRISPEQLRVRLSLRGDASATLLLTRTPGGARAFLVELADPMPVA